MSENYQYAECKHCGKSVMESEIHSCKKMYLAEIEEFRLIISRYKLALDEIAQLPNCPSFQRSVSDYANIAKRALEI